MSCKIIVLYLLLVGCSAIAEKLNVLFITVDDLRPELGCYGNTTVKSPNIDRLASRGMRFEKAYVQQALCGPSRCCVLSGMRPGSTGIHENSAHVTTVVPEIITLPKFFQQNGWRTMSVGKVYHNVQDDFESWDWRGDGYRSNWADPAVKEYFDRRTEEGKAKGLSGWRLYNYACGPATECFDVADNAYTDGGITDEAIQALEKMDSSKPFFFAVGYTKPHLPFCAPKKYWDLYDRNAIEMPYSREPIGAPEYSLSPFTELRAFSDIPEKGPVPEEKIRELIHGYHACVSFVDAQIGRLFQCLEKQGLLENTIIVLWGDHGWKLGDHGHWCKHSNHEIDTHSPLLVTAPGMKPGSTKALVEMVDIYPTLADLCSLPIPQHCEGLSFKPVLEDASKPWKEAVFSEFNRDWHGVHGVSLTDGRWRYTQWRDQKTGEVKSEELYDHRDTVLSKINQAANPEYRTELERMRRLFSKGWETVRSDTR